MAREIISPCFYPPACLNRTEIKIIENFPTHQREKFIPQFRVCKFVSCKLQKNNLNLDPIRKDVVTGWLILVAISLLPYQNNVQIPDNYWNIELFTVIRDHYNKWCLIIGNTIKYLIAGWPVSHQKWWIEYSPGNDSSFII